MSSFSKLLCGISKSKVYHTLFLATNMPYFVPLLTFGNWSSKIVFVVGLISSMYHTHQCYEIETTGITHITKRLMWADIILASMLGNYVLFKNMKKINLKTAFWIATALLIYFNTRFGGKCEKLQFQYIVLHGIWHLITSYVATKLCEPDDPKN